MPVIHDSARQRFVMTVDGGEVETFYRMQDADTIEFYHTRTPKELRGNGYARAVVESALDYAEKSGFKVIPTCSYVKNVFESRAIGRG